MRNGSGIYVPPAGSWNPAINGNQATAADWQILLQDITNALTQSVASDGQTPMTGSLNMGGNRLIGLGAPTGQGHALRYQQLSQGGDLTAASDVTIPNEGGFFVVNGTTTIDTFSGSFVGRRVTLRFDDEVALRASIQMVLPGDVDYQTEAGEILEVIQISPGIWQLLTAGGGAGIGGPGRQMVVTSSGNIVLPASRIWITACGAGGNGGPNGGAGTPGGGGGGGALFIRREFTVTRGATALATMGAPGSTATSLAGVFTLASGGNGTSSVGGTGGAASSQGSGGIAAAGGAGGGRTLGGTGVGGGGGGSLGGGGAGGHDSNRTRAGYPGGVQYGTAPSPGGNLGLAGSGISTAWGGIGGFTDPSWQNSGAGSWGAGGGGAGGTTSATAGAGGPAIIVIEW